MTTLFSDLSRSPVVPTSEDGSLGEAQRAIDTLFPKVVSSSPLRLWSLGDPIPATGDRLLVGVATWSQHDMRLLDALAAALEAKGFPLTIDVFNVADCTSAEAFEQYVPGLGKVFHTPVVGLWSEGRLIEKGSGKAGRDLAYKVGGLGSS